MPRNLKRLAARLLAATALLAPATLVAQTDDPDPNVAVQNRARPEFDPIGLRAGSFFIFPQVTVGGLYDDNVFAEDDDEESDFAATIAPRLLVRSDFSRHALTLDAGGDLAFYQDNDDLNYQDVYAKAGGRVEITRNNLLIGSAGINRLHEDPSSSDFTQGEEEVNHYLREELGLDYRRIFNRLYIQPGVSFQRYDFEDSDFTNEDYRDRNQYLGNLRAGYEISPRLGTFVQGTYDVRRYDQTPDDAGRDRDSEGVAGRVGATVDITSILFGEVGVGYNYRTFDDDELDNVGGLGYDAELTWNVTPLTTVILTGQGAVQETTVNFEGDEASANLQKLISLDVTHELLRNLLVNANASYIRDDFEGTSRTDNRFIAGAGLSYFLNRHLALEAKYTFATRDSDEEQDEFTRNIVMLGVTARL
jgi:hypothetical protein